MPPNLSNKFLWNFKNSLITRGVRYIETLSISIFRYYYRIEFDIANADLDILSINQYIEIKLQYFGLWLRNLARNKGQLCAI